MYKFTLISFLSDGTKRETSINGCVTSGDLHKFISIINTYYFDRYERNRYELILTEAGEDEILLTIYYCDKSRYNVCIRFESDAYPFIDHINWFDFHNNIPMFYMKAELFDDSPPKTLLTTSPDTSTTASSNTSTTASSNTSTDSSPDSSTGSTSSASSDSPLSRSSVN